VDFGNATQLYCIGDREVKTLTKTEQKSEDPENFLSDWFS
jgi:hypothetical protein